MNYLDDYPAGTVEGDLLRDPVEMLRSLREQEERFFEYSAHVLLLQELVEHLFAALEAPDKPLLARQARSEVKRYRARQMRQDGSTIAAIAKAVDVTPGQVKRYVRGVPKGSPKG